MFWDILYSDTILLVVDYILIKVCVCFFASTSVEEISVNVFLTFASESDVNIFTPFGTHYSIWIIGVCAFHNCIVYYI